MTAVCIATYNHASYLSQAIESVRMQVCDEPVRIYIGDDASTDGTAEICRKYADEDKRIVYVRHEKNIGVVANTLALYRRIIADGCEYVAMLDGDDYWTDPHKLQRQTDWLRSHPETGFVHTAAEGQGQAAVPTGDLSRRYDLAGARQTNSTVLFRTDLLDEAELDEIERQGFPVLDYPLYGVFSQRTSFGYLPEPTAVWREHVSVSRPASVGAQLRYKKERLRMWHWLDKKYNGYFHFRRYRAILWYLWQIFYILFAQIKKKLYRRHAPSLTGGFPPKVRSHRAAHTQIK